MYNTETVRGLEATPIVVDGVMYITGSWSKVYALNAKTGEELWTYDPAVPGEWPRFACCDVVNRCVAVWQGRVYVASLDGRLIALDSCYRTYTCIHRLKLQHQGDFCSVAKTSKIRSLGPTDEMTLFFARHLFYATLFYVLNSVNNSLLRLRNMTNHLIKSTIPLAMLCFLSSQME